MRFALYTLFYAVLALLAAGAILVLIGKWRAPQEDWRVAFYLLVFGPPDTTPVDFAALSRSNTPTDALACPEQLCKAKADFTIAPIAMPADKVKAVIEQALVERREQKTATVAASTKGAGFNTISYVARTRLMQFPDVLHVRLEEKDGKTLLALYSASQLGSSDFGVNKARIGDLLARFGAM
jgi:uncharacterized protein (DUF1499 family)